MDPFSLKLDPAEEWFRDPEGRSKGPVPPKVGFPKRLLWLTSVRAISVDQGEARVHGKEKWVRKEKVKRTHLDNLANTCPGSGGLK